MNEKERWLPVVGYEGIYEVSNLGRVRSLDRKVNSKNGSKRNHKGQLLKFQVNQSGYYQTAFCVDGGFKHRYVHNLVIEAFVGKCPIGQQVRHLDGNSINNHLSNLVYGTPKENYQDKILHGTDSVGSNNGNAKLDESTVKDIRLAFSYDFGPTELAKFFKTPLATIKSIVYKRTWSHI